MLIAKHYLYKMFIFLLLIIPWNSLCAHPHISINAFTHYYFDQSGFTGFYIQWIYDPMFSSQIIYECDTDMDKSFSKNEVAQVKYYYFTRLNNYDYFTELKIENRNEILGKPLNFNAEIDTEDEVVIFTFYIPVNHPYSRDGTGVYVGFSDPTNYTAFICPQRSLSVFGNVHKISDIKINRLGSISFRFQ